MRVLNVACRRPSCAAFRNVRTCMPYSSAKHCIGRSPPAVSFNRFALDTIERGGVRRPESQVRYVCSATPSRVAKSTCDNSIWRRRRLRAFMASHTMPSRAQPVKRVRSTAIEMPRMVGEEVFLVARQRPVRTVIRGELEAPIRAQITSDSRFQARNGAPGRTRTCDPRLRRTVLYPTELRARSLTRGKRLVGKRLATYQDNCRPDTWSRATGSNPQLEKPTCISGCGCGWPVRHKDGAAALH